jgi:sterol desaturase/sphingolipid hydroxylase (fatty acid hydroxylase superfamily)
LDRITVVVPGNEVQVQAGPRFRRDVEARRSRQRLWPVSVLYTAYALTVVGFGAASDHPVVALLTFLLGTCVWTLVEYKVHRYILHGRFPDGPGFFQHLLHKAFDHLHWEHHKRPWDGNHINGTIKDTLPFVLPMALLAHLGPVWAAPALLAGILQAYVVEEWVHHSVHFYSWSGLYFRYIKRHHLYHHSPRGMAIAFGLTNGFWDIVYDTRIPADVRQALYEPLRSAQPGAGRGRRELESPESP